MIGLPWAALLLAAVAEPPAPAPPAAVVRESIVVVAERGPTARSAAAGAVSVVERETLERRPAATLAELIGDLPGVQVLFPAAVGGVPMASARGFFGAGEAEVLQLRVDGVPLADEESGIADWRFLRASALERIEVLRGPASSLYGDTALGGVVDVRTRSPREAQGASVALAGGSFGTGGADAAFERQLGRGGFRVGASGERTGGFRDHSAAGASWLEIAAGGPLAGGDWRGALSALDRRRDDPGPLSPNEILDDRGGSNERFRFDREDLGRQRAWLGWDGRALGATWSSRLHAQRRTSDFLRTLLVAAELGDRVKRDLAGRSLGLSLDGTRGGDAPEAPWQARWGAEGARQSVDVGYRRADDRGGAGERLAARSATREAGALFASLSRTAGSRARFWAGLRADALSDRSSALPGTSGRSALSPRLGGVVRLGDRRPVVAFLALSRSFKAPTLDQLYDPRPFPDFAGGSFTISNPGLEPQTAESVDLGLSRTGVGARWEIAAYRTDVEREIDFDPATFRYLNLGSSRHRGVEAAWERSAGALRPSLQWTWTRVEPLAGENRGRQLKNIPEHRGRAALDARLGRGFEATAAVQWIGERWLDDGHLFRLAPVAVADLAVARALGRGRLQVEVANLLDRRWTAVGYTLPDVFGGLVPYQFPAPGRAVRAAYAWRAR